MSNSSNPLDARERKLNRRGGRCVRTALKPLQPCAVSKLTRSAPRARSSFASRFPTTFGAPVTTITISASHNNAEIMLLRGYAHFSLWRASSPEARGGTASTYNKIFVLQVLLLVCVKCCQPLTARATGLMRQPRGLPEMRSMGLALLDGARARTGLKCSL